MEPSWTQRVSLKITPWSESASELYRPSDLSLVGEVSVNFYRYKVSRNQREGSLRPYSRRSRLQPLIFFQVAPQLYSRDWVDPFPDILLIRKSGSAGVEPRSLDLKPGTLTTRPQRQSTFFCIAYNFSSYLTGSTIHLHSVARKSDHRGGPRLSTKVLKYFI
jgi:hypothetical protein